MQKQSLQKQNERWRVLELSFKSTQPYDNPYQDVDLDVHFTAPDGSVITMPGFWYGENLWKVRFAPPTVGKWRYQSICSSPSDKGLHQQSGTFDVTAYRGDLAIYKHGFLKVSETKRYLEHDDGTPFFWLGDTHWLGLSAKERLYESNDPRFASQFQGIIQRRLEQGFTVWAGSLMLGEWERRERFCHALLWHLRGRWASPLDGNGLSGDGLERCSSSRLYSVF